MAAIFFLAAAVIAPNSAHPASGEPIELSALPTDSNALPDRPVLHDIAIETVAAGQEGLELSARLTEDGGLITRPVSWTVKGADDGQTVYSGAVPVADVVTAPGDYVIDIKYGAVHVAETVTVVKGTRLIASFVLNAGGVRILPRIGELGLPATPSLSLV
ncbi:MAG: hypothetical protein HY245_07215 [Rhizobiales bacterium]|nr:hypothetical protein [Hyphomicrobiales bacterium]